MDFKILTDIHFGFIILFLCISVFISLLFYKNKSLSNPLKYSLIIIRTLWVFLLLVLLSNPVIAYISNTTQRPIHLILFDISASNLINSKSDFANKLFDEIKSSGESIKFFSVDVTEARDSIYFTGIDNFKTNLSSAIDKVFTSESENYSSVTIISDGIINSGGNPVFTAKSLQIPFNYYLTGDTIQKNDVSLKNIFYNKTSYAGALTPVKLEIFSSGYNGTLNIEVFENDNILETKTIEVNDLNKTYFTEFKITSPEESIKKYKIAISPQQDETTLLNNSETFYIKYLDNKFRLLVISGSPSSDLAFLKSELNKINNFEITYLTQKSSTEYYEKELPDLSKINCFLLLGFPTQISNVNLINDINKYVKENNASLFFITSRTIDYSKLSLLENILPFRTSIPSDIEEITSVNSVGNPDTEIFSIPEFLNSVNAMPPVFKTGSLFTPAGNSQTFLITGTGGQPAFLIKRDEISNSAALLFYGFYKWRLNPSGIDGGKIFNYIISNTIFSISDKEKQKKLLISTEKPVYSKFENIKIDAKINFDLMSDGEFVNLNIKNQGYNETIRMNKKSNDFFESFLNSLPEGEYNISGELFNGSELLDKDEIKILIGENNFEFKETKSENKFLKELADNTNGKNFTGMSGEEIIADLSKIETKPAENFSQSLKNALNINPFYFIFLILLMGTEWFLRKRNNLP
ncbi:MAG: hypothetical protein IAE65_00355 [Ignavibacteria bacterium]|nr:hypothetical protein [Ignavibacteria bacterium]